MKPARFTTIAIVALVALRLGCGWLFFREGSKKLDSGTFTSTHFLKAAKGPFAGAYLGMVPDIYGAVRLDKEQTRQQWEYYHNEAAGHFDFDEDQKDQAKAAFDRAVAQLSWYLASIEEEREENTNEIIRLESAQDDPTAAVNYRSNWMESKEGEVDRQLNTWLAKIDTIWDRYEAEVNDIASEGLLDVGGKEMTQLEYYGKFRLRRAGASGISSTFADTVIPWFTFLVGVLLVLGLFTRVAAVGGSLFLLSVVASQPPFVPGADDTNYQIVLMLGLLVVAAVGAGRWGGLDFYLGWCWGSCCGKKTANPGSESEISKKN